jgi:hypothetical protein
LDIPPANIDMVTKQDNNRVLIFFSYPEHDLSTGDTRTLFDEEMTEYIFQETNATIRSRRSQSVPARTPKMAQTHFESSSTTQSTGTSGLSVGTTEELECPKCTKTCPMFANLQFKDKTASSSSASHPICENCARQAVEVMIESTSGLDRIPCPCGTCDGGVLQYKAVQTLISKSNPKLFDQYVKQTNRRSLHEAKHASRQSLGGFEQLSCCSNLDCGSVQAVTETSGAWTCRSCGYRTCVIHDRPAFARKLVPHADGGLVAAAEENESAACCLGFYEDTQLSGLTEAGKARL